MPCIHGSPQTQGHVHIGTHPHHWRAVESILWLAPGDDYRGAAWLQESWSAGSAALIPETRANVNPSKGIFSSQAFVSYLKNGCFKSSRWRNWDHRKCGTDDTAYFVNNVLRNVHYTPYVVTKLAMTVMNCQNLIDRAKSWLFGTIPYNAIVIMNSLRWRIYAWLIVKKWRAPERTGLASFYSKQGYKIKEERVMKRMCCVWRESMNSGCSWGADGYHDNESRRCGSGEVGPSQFITAYSCVCVCWCDFTSICLNTPLKQAICLFHTSLAYTFTDIFPKM